MNGLLNYLKNKINHYIKKNYKKYNIIIKNYIIIMFLLFN